MNMTVSEVIEQLQKLELQGNGDMEMYFDCPHCGRANIFSAVMHVAVIVTTKQEKG